MENRMKVDEDLSKKSSNNDTRATWRNDITLDTGSGLKEVCGTVGCAATILGKTQGGKRKSSREKKITKPTRTRQGSSGRSD